MRGIGIGAVVVLLAGLTALFSLGGSGTAERPAWAESPSPSFDGRWFVFVGRPSAGSQPAIYRAGIDGPGPRRITMGTGDPAGPIVIPGDEVLFSDRAPESPQARALYACSLDGSRVRRVTRGPHRDLSPSLLDDGRVRFERTLLAGPRAGERLALTIHPDGTNLSAAATDEEILAPVEPFLVLPRRVPPLLTSVVNEARATGTLLCLDVRDSRLPEVASLPAGRVASVQAFQVRGEEDSRGPVVAEAPVHPDGSFLMEVPADTLLGLTLRDRDGAALATFASGVWVRPNENRGCVGCHESADRAPANRRPMALRPVAKRGEGAGHD